MSLLPSDVAVVIVTWNGRRHLEALLPTLLPQRPGEIIVVDNASQDGTAEWLRREHPGVRVLRNDRNLGFAAPNNRGAAATRRPVLAFLNNDTRCHSDWLARGLEALDQAECAACRLLDWEGKRLDFHRGSLQYLGFALQEDTGKLLRDVTTESGEILFPCGGAMFIRREVFEAVGGFDPDFFAIFEDVDLGWRLWLAGYRVVAAPQSMVCHRGHGTFQEHAPARLRYLMHRNALATVLKNYEDEYVRKVFPAALFTAVRRAVRLSGIPKESFYLWRSDAPPPGPPPAAGEDAWLHLVALDDVLEQLPRWLEKRAAVQALRRRRDAEILRLFRDPLRPIVEDAGYIRFEADLLEALGLGDVWDVSAYRAAAERFTDPLPEKVESLRQELRRLQWWGTFALEHPPLPKPPGRLHRFARRLRRLFRK
ncbi:MAG: hypothetical protein Kow00109_10930 [Acidobacteriota bacterium]